MERKRRNVNILAGALMGTLLLSGCGESTYGTVTPPERTLYEKTEYMITDVHKGDMKPTLSLTLKPVDVTRLDYTVDESELELDEILIQAGDSVKKGQVLITFKSDEIKKEIEKYSDELNRKQMLLDHYTRVSNVTYDEKERNEKYGVVLEELADDVLLAKTYLEEAQQRLSKCQVVAKEDGFVSYVSNKVINSYVEQGDVLLTEHCGKNRFAAGVSNDFEFNIGDIYTAGDENVSYDMRVVEINPGEEEERTIIFESVDNAADLGRESLKMVIDKPQIDDAVYVDNDAVHYLNDKTFVYVVSEDGFLDAVYVEVDDTVGEYTIIKSGLNGTEKVAKK